MRQKALRKSFNIQANKDSILILEIVGHDIRNGEISMTPNLISNYSPVKTITDLNQQIEESKDYFYKQSQNAIEQLKTFNYMIRGGNKVKQYDVTSILTHIDHKQLFELTQLVDKKTKELFTDKEIIDDPFNKVISCIKVLKEFKEND